MTDIYTLFSSSSGNSALVATPDVKIMIDAGVSAAKINRALDDIGIMAEQIDAICITHEHSDHTSGLKVFAKKCTCPIYGNEKTIKKILEFCPQLDSRCHIICEGEPFEIGSVTVKCFPTPHDSVASVGYIIESEGKKYGIATDTGTVTKSMLANLCGCEAVIVEANHDEIMLKEGPYPYHLKKRILSDIGHLSNDKCAWLVTQLAIWGTKKIMLAHLSEQNNAPTLAYDTARKMLEANGFIPARDVILKVAPKEQICKL